MTDVADVRIERLGAIVLLLLSCAGMLWLRCEAAAVEAAAGARREQLDHLLTLSVPRGAGSAAEEKALQPFAGLLAGHEPVWQRTPIGTVLSLRVIDQKANAGSR